MKAEKAFVITAVSGACQAGVGEDSVSFEELGLPTLSDTVRDGLDRTDDPEFFDTMVRIVDAVDHDAEIDAIIKEKGGTTR